MTAVTHALGSHDSTLISLFIEDACRNGALLSKGLLGLQDRPGEVADVASLLSCAAQSIKGAARIVDCVSIANLAESMESCLDRLQNGDLAFSKELCVVLLEAAQLLVAVGELDGQALEGWLGQAEPVLREAAASLKAANSVRRTGGTQPVRHNSVSGGAGVRRDSLLGQAGVREPVLRESVAREPVIRSAAPRAAVLSIIPAVDSNIFALFRAEAEACTANLNSGLVHLETGGAEVLEELMRSAHSLKGAARVVGIGLATRVAHALEECFVAAQRGELSLRARDVDALFAAVDLLSELADCASDGLNLWQQQRESRARAVIANLEELARGELLPGSSKREVLAQISVRGATLVEASVGATPTRPEVLRLAEKTHAETGQRDGHSTDRVVKVAAASINRLMGLAGESLVESRSIQGLNQRLKQLKQKETRLADVLEALRSLPALKDVAEAGVLLNETAARALECRTLLTREIDQMDAYARRVDDLSERLYREAQRSRMRPFGDCVQGLPRMMRDVARKLGKQVKLQVGGESTQVDRDVLESLDAPLSHLLRNALDHGVEAPEERLALGKSKEAVIRLEAHHHAGMLRITISDDGRGIDPEMLRERIVQKGLLNPETAADLSLGELMEFIFLPGFSTATAVTEISGRGVGLDAVRTSIQSASGTVRVTSEPARGTSFHLELPVTRSVLRAVVTSIDGEAYAFPLLRIERILRIPQSELLTLGTAQFFVLRDENVALVSTRQLLGLGAKEHGPGDICVVVVGAGGSRYGLVVDEFIGEHDLVVRPLDRRLGKVQDIAAAAILMDGAPALIFDSDDLVRSVEKLAHAGRIDQLPTAQGTKAVDRKRILVVDDSIVVREAERQLLLNNGYETDVAVDGIDGWNSLRTKQYDLIVTDVDMPRMNGLELVRTIRRDLAFAKLPIIIVSYKDRQEDRMSGLEAGANCYLTKSSFHDDTLVEAVEELIGKSHS